MTMKYNPKKSQIYTQCNQKGKIRIVVGTQSHILRRGICSTIHDAKMDLVGETDNVDNLMELTSQYQPNITVTSCQLPGLTKEDLIKHIKDKAPATSILIICENGCDEETKSDCFTSAIEAGAEGFLSIHNAPVEQLADAIRSLYHGATVVNTDIIRQAMFNIKYPKNSGNPPDSLNSREMEVLQLASRGMSNRAIAEHLSFSERTIQGYFHYIFSKIGAHSRTEAIYTALKNGWINVS